MKEYLKFDINGAWVDPVDARTQEAINPATEEATAIANDTPYGLLGYVSSSGLTHATRIAARLRTGKVHINNAPGDQMAPFGGYKQLGNGREWSDFGFEKFLEVKAVMGSMAAD